MVFVLLGSSAEVASSQDHLGLAGERAGDGNALLLPAGELAGIALRLLRKTNAVEQLESTGAVCLRYLAGGGEEREADVVQHGLLRQQAKVLEDHRHATAIRAKLLAGERGDVAAIDLDDARCGALEEVDRANERRLAGTAHTDDAEDVTVGDLEIDVRKGVNQAVGLDRRQGFGRLVSRLHDRGSSESRISAHRSGVGHLGLASVAFLAGRFGRGERFVHMLDADHEENSA